jgi:hypothetical protein
MYANVTVRCGEIKQSWAMVVDNLDAFLRRKIPAVHSILAEL